MKTLLLIDANSIIHRSFHALPPFTTRDGKPSGALYGLASILLKLWREDRPAESEARLWRPDYVSALFDRPEPTFRKKKYAEYKAHRPKAPDELVRQIIEAHNLFSQFGIKTFEKAGFEADDLIATLAKKFRGVQDLQVVILTGDLDTLQLVRGEKVVVCTFKKGVSDTKIYDERMVHERYGLKPRQLIDYKALVGDPSDNIKGVPGIGPKTARDMLQRFGSLEKLYGNLDSDPKLAKKLAPFRENAALSRDLVELRDDVPLELGALDGLKVKEDQSAIKSYFRQLGFETLIKRLEAGDKTVGKTKSKQSSLL